MLARRNIRGARALTVLLAVITTIAVSPPTAALAADGPHYWMYTDDPAPNGGRVDFWSLGDIVQLCDNDADGARAKVNVHDLTTHKNIYRLEASGSEVCDTARASDGGKYDLTEGHCFWFSIWLEDNGTVVPGSEDNAYWRNYNDAKVDCTP